MATVVVGPKWVGIQLQGVPWGVIGKFPSVQRRGATYPTASKFLLDSVLDFLALATFYFFYVLLLLVIFHFPLLTPASRIHWW